MRLSRGYIVKGIKIIRPSERMRRMKHTLKISVSKKPVNGGIAACRTVKVRERLLRFLLGKPMKLTVIVPGDSVEELLIKEVGGAVT